MGQIIFIDDSGDPGFKKGSSRYFVIACIVFEDEAEAKRAAKVMQSYKTRLGWGDKAEFKFNKTNKKYILELFELLNDINFYIIATLIDKSAIDETTKPAVLYNQTICDTLMACGLNEAKVRLDGHAGRNYMKDAVAYFRKTVNKDERKIIDFRFLDSTKNILVQLADLVAGSILRSTKDDKTDSGNYMHALKEKVRSINKIG
jgi:hypothetical protein